MGFIKVLKKPAFFKRFQTKLRRRREGKTDYYARKRLILQDKNKYNTPKYRLVVRKTNGKIICQITYSTIVKDVVICQANSAEFKKWIKLPAKAQKNKHKKNKFPGLANYPAAYATGLLLGRRLLKKLKMDNFYAGNENIDGEKYDVSQNQHEERRPFKAILDIGLTNSTVGNKVFGAMKGATDAGIYVPHSASRFPGNFKDDDGKVEFQPEFHKDRIFGAHIDQFMKTLKEESSAAYQKQFSIWDMCLKENKVDSCAKLYEKLHQQIKADPVHVKKVHKNPKRTHKNKYAKKLTLAERKKRIQAKFAIALQAKKQQ